MIIRVRDLKRLIRHQLIEIGGGTSTTPRPLAGDPMSSSLSDREQLGRNSIRSLDDPDEVAPHLQEPVYDEEECWGPVPPKAPSPHAMPDPLNKDYHVIPTPTIKR